MNSVRIYTAIVAIAVASSASAEGPFFELDGANGFWGSPGVPDDAFKLLKQVQTTTDARLKCFAFAAGGDWLFLFGGNGFYTSNVDLPVCKKLAELQKEDADFKCVAFAPGGGWTILWNKNGNWTEGKIPDAAFKKLQEVANQGGELRSIAFGPHGAWVLLFDKTGVWHGNVPKELAKVLDDAVRKRLSVRCVAFSGEDWICLTNDGWWTSNLDLPSSKLIARNIKQGYAPKWIAITPALGPHDFEEYARIIHRALDGKLAGGYAFEVLDHGKVVAQGAEGWARAPWEKDHPSVPWTLDKPMGVASVSKTVTAVALLKLWEESRGTDHQFSLDDPFWPHIRKLCPKAHDDVKRVTIRQLLRHRSGFAKMDDYTTPQDLEKLLTRPLAHPPGTHSEYQNNNFYIPHLLIEQIGNTSYTPYVKGHVLIPMGIHHMETHVEAHQPTCGYLKPGKKRPGFPFDWKCEPWAGAAGWFASVSDLGRFVNGIREHKVLSPETTQMMIQDGMGWDGTKPGCVKGGLWVWDEGSGAGARAGQVGSAIAHFPDGVDAVILVNCEPPVDIEDLLVRAWTDGRGK